MHNRKKEIDLLALSCVFILIFLLAPGNREWAGVIVRYWRSLPIEYQFPAKEERMEMRFGTQYHYSKQIADVLKTKGVDSSLVLLAPTSYFNKMGIDYHVPEPAVFYYFTGVKTVWANSPEAIKADYYVRAGNREIIIDAVTDRKRLADSIQMFRKLGVSL